MRLVVLTGAGISAESGVPTFRDALTGLWARYDPAQLATPEAFERDPELVARWYDERRCSVARCVPNAGHVALAQLQRQTIDRGGAFTLITQNVDRLHQAAGSRNIVELHGALADVLCLECGAREDRGDLQARLLAANPGWLERAITEAPDGDAELSAEEVAGFQVVGCPHCAGTQMPDVVFFGGSVPQAKVAAAWKLVDGADVLLVVGSSLAVYSGWRFARGARERGIPIAIVNMGPTRADDISHLHIQAPAGVVLSAVTARLILD